MKNVYKYMNVFKCIHEAHHHFESRMSVHHILNTKKCFPNGCFYFKWHCKLMEQGKKCYRGFQYIGNKCDGCRYFYDEKIYNHPEIQLSEAEYQNFLAELREFEDWLLEHENRELEISGKVDGVKPLFQKQIYPKGQGIAFRGFLLIFKQLYLGYTLMDDYIYARVSPKTYASLRLGRGDLLNARAILTVDRGRLILKRLRKIDIESRGEPPLWNESSARVARKTATEIPAQPEGCIQCPYGSLIDVEDGRGEPPRKYRQLYCLQGMNDYRSCPEYSLYSSQEESASKVPLNAASCLKQKVNVDR